MPALKLKRYAIFLVLTVVILSTGFGCRSGDHFPLFGLGSDPAGMTKITDDPHDDMNPAWNPQDSRIAFVSDRAGHYDLWVMKDDGSDLRPLTTDIAVDRYPAWSPDGSQIAFASTRSGNWDIWVMNGDGSRLKRLTTHRMADLSPSWSRDGKKLAFVSYRDLEYSIYVMDTDGQNQRKITTGGNGDWGPVFSPDGESIAFTSSRSGGGDLYLIDTRSGSEYRRLTVEPARDMLPAWSPDGGWIAFVSERGGDRDLWVVREDGTGPQSLTRGIYRHRRPLYDVDREFIEGLGYYMLSWSPDGKKLAFTSIRRDGKGDIAILSVHPPVAGPKQESVPDFLQLVESRMTDDDGWELFPSWSPDGGEIAYIQTLGQGFSDIWVMDSDGKARKKLTTKPFTKYFEPSFNPDGKSLLFFSDSSGNDDIWSMDANGRNLRRLTNDPAADYHPSWSPDGAQVAFISKRSGKNAIWLMDRSGENQRLLVSVGLDDCDLTPAWTPDGRKILYAAREGGQGEEAPTLNCQAFSGTKPPFTSSCPSHILEADVETAEVRRLTSGDFHDGRVAVHPSGDLVTFTSNRSGSWDLWMMDRQGSRLQRLTSHEGYEGYSAWSPDGKKFVFVSDRAGGLDLWLATVE